MQDCWVKNNINLWQNRQKIMEKTAHHQKNIHVQNHAPIAPADCHVKIEYFVHVSWWHINYRSYIHNGVTYITNSHSPLWHICCCIACILRLLYITMWQMKICFIHMKVTFLTIHFVTYISRVLISQKYSPFLHIYRLVSYCLTSVTGIYITIYEWKLLHVDACYEWYCLHFAVFYI